MSNRFDIEQVIRILGLEIRADRADDGRDFDVACRIALEKLMKCKEYEELEEQGLLLQLPCKVGDTVYIISRNNEIIPLNVHGIDIRKDNFTILAKNEEYYGYSILSLLDKYESVDWFITQAESEQKLKEMSKWKNYFIQRIEVNYDKIKFRYLWLL